MLRRKSPGAGKVSVKVPVGSVWASKEIPSRRMFTLAARTGASFSSSTRPCKVISAAQSGSTSEPSSPNSTLQLTATPSSGENLSNVACATQQNTLWTGRDFSPILPLVFVDYYEALQISPNADQETVHRVYRVQAQRFHPDNQETGHAPTFRLIADA